MDRADLAKFIDYSLLKADATEKQVRELCLSAKKLRTNSVCITPCYVRHAKKILGNSGVRVACVVGYPLGANLTETKVFEAQKAIRDGAGELDVVMNIGEFKSKKHSFVLKELKEIVDAAKKIKKNVKVKIIIEAGLLNNDEIKKASLRVLKSGADFVKTGTGWSRGASVRDVRLIKSAVKNRIGIKAAGGIRTRKQAEALIKAGATRIGTSSAEEILK